MALNTNKKPTILELLRYIRDSRSSKGSERLLLWALALRAKPPTWMCWPSYRKLAEDTCMDPATMKRAARSLEEAGLIRREIRRNRSNRFYINFNELKRQAEVKLELDEAATAALADDVDPLLGWGGE